MEEIWKQIIWKYVETKYLVSNLGRVRYFDKTECLNQQIDKLGYSRVALGRVVKWRPLVHRLVAIAFIPNPNNLPEVNHKFGIKTDNRASELEWCTHRQNIQHAFKYGLKTMPMGARSSQSKSRRSANEWGCAKSF